MSGTEVQTMEGKTFDHTVKAMASSASRRTVLRALAAGLFVAGGGGIATSALAKKGRKKTSKKNPPQSQPQNAPNKCPQGKSVAYLAVPSDGSRVFTPVLRQGQPYLLRASGYWSTNGDYMNDAFAAFLWKNQQSPVLYNNGVRLGLAVNGESPDLWGTYKQSHTYSLVIIGKGEPVSLQMLDSVYSDNGRLLNVEVLCAAPLRD